MFMELRAAREKAKLVVEEIWTRLKEYRSRRKPVFDKYVDPTLAWLAGNAAYIYGADRLLNVVFQHANSHGGLAKLATYAGLVMGWPYVNKHIIIPVARGIKEFHKKRIRKGVEATALSWVRTASQLGVLLALYNALSFGTTLGNFRYDGMRITRAFESDERKNQERIEEEKVASITPTALEALIPKKIGPVDIRETNPHSYYGRFLRVFRWSRILEKVEGEFGIPPGLLAGLAMRESFGDPLALNANDDGGAGLFMFQPGTAKLFGLKVWGNSNATGRDRNYGIKLRQWAESMNWDYERMSKEDERFDVEKSARAAAKYLKVEYKKYGSWDAALSAYNCGMPSRSPEDTDHVRSVRVYQRCYLKNVKELGEEVSESSLKEVERWFNRHFPPGKGAACSSQGSDYTDLPDFYFEFVRRNREGNDVFSYQVRRGDNPTVISRKFDRFDASVFGDKYENTGWRNVVNENGRILARINPKQEVFIVARKKQHR